MLGWFNGLECVHLVLSSTCNSEKPQVRSQFRKGAHCVSKQDNSVEESFEDLLSKYKQIQLELECIRKEETMALEPKVSPSIDQIPAHPASVPDSKQVQVAVPLPEESLQAEVIEKKVFQAFNIRPLRQRLPVSPHLAEKCDDQEDKGSPAEMEGESKQSCSSLFLLLTISLRGVGREEMHVPQKGKWNRRAEEQYAKLF